MNSYRQLDWATCAQHPTAVHQPYLMGTGVVLGDDLPPGRLVSPPHRHPEAMLAWCYRGTVWVYLETTMWRLSPGQGVWVPAGMPHTARHERDAIGCYTYVPSEAFTEPVDDVKRVVVPRAVQEMLLHLSVHNMPTDLRVRAQQVMLDMLEDPEMSREDGALEVPLPVDERVRSLVEAVLERPGDTRTAQELFAQHGLHERTVLRVFTSEVGMSFGQWRTGVRMTSAARFIVGGTPVGIAGQMSGYETTSAFSAAFKGYFGATPRQFATRARADSAQQGYWRSFG